MVAKGYRRGIAYYHSWMWIHLNFHKHFNVEINRHTYTATHATEHWASFWQPKKLDACAIEIRKLDFNL